MKKAIILISVLCFFGLSASQAQVIKGRSLLGVSTSFSYINFGSDLFSLGFSSVKYKSNSSENVDPDVIKVTTVNIQPKFGYFIANNLAVGLNVSLGSSTSKPQSGGKSTLTSFGVGPFVRYYISESKIMPFFEINSLFGSMTDKYEGQGYNNSSSSSLRSIGGGAGLAVKVGEKVTFDMMAVYNSLSEKAKENNPNDNRTVQGTLGFKFGFVVLFGTN
jgi:hypothetical protein